MFLRPKLRSNTLEILSKSQKSSTHLFQQELKNQAAKHGERKEWERLACKFASIALAMPIKIWLNMPVCSLNLIHSLTIFQRLDCQRKATSSKRNVSIATIARYVTEDECALRHRRRVCISSPAKVLVDRDK
jgi:hypothetical protein